HLLRRPVGGGQRATGELDPALHPLLGRALARRPAARRRRRRLTRGEPMGVYFVYRSHYATPSGKKVTRFEEDDNVIDWVARLWKLALAHPGGWQKRYDFEVSGFTFFSRAAEIVSEGGAPPPEYAEALAEWLEEEVYVEGALICHLPHLVTGQSDDDELQFA